MNPFKDTSLYPQERILSFLGKAWSGDKKTRVIFHDGIIFYSDTEHRIIYLTKYDKDTIFKTTDPIDKWRLYRYADFHEAMHLYLTPKYFMDELYKRKISPTVYNIVEDYRIEKEGIKEYIGYVDEKKFFDAFICSAKEKTPSSPPPLPSPMVKSMDVLRILDALSTDLLRGGRILPSTRSMLKQDEIALIEKFATWIKPIVDPEEAFNVAKMITDELRLNLEWEKELSRIDSNIYRGLEYPEEWAKWVVVSVSKDDMEKSLKEMGYSIEEVKGVMVAPDGIKKEFDAAMKMSDREKKEYLDHLVEEAKLLGREGSLEPSSNDLQSNTTWDELISDQAYNIQRLKTMLQKWQVGWKEVYDTSGDDVDVDQYIATRYSKDNIERIFYNELKLFPKTKIYILLDMSGSISGSELIYKKVCAVICECLNYVGAKFELLVYRGSEDKSGFVLVKDIKEQWDANTRRILASIDASGGTPLTPALESIEVKCSKEGINKIFIINDGQPNNPETTTEMIKKLEHRGMEIFLIGIGRATLYESFKALMRYRNLNRICIIEDINELPMKFFTLISSSTDQ